MSVYLLRNYQGFTASATVPVTLGDTTESSLIAQGLAVNATTQVTSAPNISDGPDMYVTQGGNIYNVMQTGYTTPAFLQGNSILPNIALGSAALTGYETNGATQVAGTWQYSEIYVPYLNTWKGIGVLNGTTVGTSLVIVALYGTSGALLANSAVAGVVTATASVMQNRNFINPILLVPGRYFLAVQYDTATDTVRHVLSANGSNVICGSQTGTFGTVPASITTVSSTFTTAVAPICQLFTT
jgi:hypothetical protein